MLPHKVQFLPGSTACGAGTRAETEGSPPPILIRHLRKYYAGLGGCFGFGGDPPVRAVKDFALKVEMGEIFGLLGVVSKLYPLLFVTWRPPPPVDNKTLRARTVVSPED